MTETATGGATGGDWAVGTGHPAGDSAASEQSREARARTREVTGRVDRHWAVTKRAVRWLRRAFTPPDMWGQRRPSLAEVVTYAREGTWTTDVGPLRTAGALYGLTAGAAGVACGYLWAWLWERPARLLAALTLTRLAWEVETVRAVAAFVAALIRFLFTPLT